MDFDWDAAGDGMTCQRSDDDDGRWSVKNSTPVPKYVKRTLSNGLPVPVYPRIKEEIEEEDEEEDDDDDKETLASFYTSRNDSTHKFEHRLPPPKLPKKPSSTWTNPSRILETPTSSSKKKSEPKNFLEEFLCCPICNEVCIEATSTNCGHKFCRECIDAWRKEKPVCPVCSSYIASIHRLYSDDQLIESQLDCLSPERKSRYRSAQDKRLRFLIEESSRSNKSIVRRIRRKLDDSVAFLRCKNGAVIKNGLSQFSKSTFDWLKSSNFGMVLGAMLGALSMLLLIHLKENYAETVKSDLAPPSMNFFRYIWLAAKKWNGNIPEEWLEEQEAMAEEVVNEQGTVDPDDVGPTLFEKIINKMYPF